MMRWIIFKIYKNLWVWYMNDVSADSLNQLENIGGQKDKRSELTG